MRAAAANFVWACACLPSWRRYAAALADPQGLATVCAVCLPDDAATGRLRDLAGRHADLECPPADLRGVRCLDRPGTWDRALDAAVDRIALHWALSKCPRDDASQSTQ